MSAIPDHPPLNQVLALAGNEHPNCHYSAQIPFFHFIDESRSLTLQQILNTHGAVWQSERASARLWEQLPANRGIYAFYLESAVALNIESGSSARLYSGFRQIIYIGKANGTMGTSTIRSRFQNEYSRYFGKTNALLGSSTNDRKSKFEYFFNCKSLFYTWTSIDSEETIDLIEKRLIEYFSPPINKQFRSKIKITPSNTISPAF